jgi:hypothetical protein
MVSSRVNQDLVRRFRSNQFLQPTDGRKETVKDPDTPKGTIALMLLYMLIIVALWGNAYATMLSRGVVQ